VSLYVDYVGGIAPNWLSGPFGVIEAMTVSQFEATGLTALVEVPGSPVPIKVGSGGTCWQTILDLCTLHQTPDYDAALQAVIKIQRNSAEDSAGL
jgi:hypothetical protein